MRIAVAGGTGTVGRHVVDSLRAAGHDAVILSRSEGVDLMTGAGLDDSLAGVNSVVDVTSTGAQDADASRRFFGTITKTLLTAEAQAGVNHHIALSIVGAASTDAGYYAGKRLQEELVLGVGSRGTVLRATQFHEFVRQILPAGRVGPLQLVPIMRTQPVAAREVGAALAQLAAHPTPGLTVDLAGPEVLRMADMVRRLYQSTGTRRPVISVPLPGTFGRALRDGTILPGSNAVLGKQTFDEWLLTQ